MTGSRNDAGARATNRGETPGATATDRDAGDQANSEALADVILCRWPFW